MAWVWRAAACQSGDANMNRELLWRFQELGDLHTQAAWLLSVREGVCKDFSKLDLLMSLEAAAGAGDSCHGTCPELLGAASC